MSGEPRNLVVAQALELQKPPELKLFLQCLVNESYLVATEAANGNSSYKLRTVFIGPTDTAVGQFELGQITGWHNQFNPDHRGNTSQRQEVLFNVGRLLVTGLFLERRLTSFVSVGLNDFVNNPPQADLHALYTNERAKAALLQELQGSFNKAAWPDITRGANVAEGERRRSPTEC